MMLGAVFILIKMFGTNYFVKILEAVLNFRFFLKEMLSWLALSLQSNLVKCSHAWEVIHPNLPLGGVGASDGRWAMAFSWDN